MTTLVILLLVSAILDAQVPQGINYQAVIRNASGQIVQNQNVTVKFGIHQATPSGTIVYEETHGSAQTNSYGLVNQQIGHGAPTIGTFSAIQWGKNSYFLQVQANIGSGYINLGTTPFLTVPYALVADSVVSIAKTGVIPNTYGNSSSFPTFTVNTQGQLTNAGSLPLPANLPPNGNAGGDLSGTYPNPLVTKLQGIPISSTVPTVGQALQWNGTAWTPTSIVNVITLNNSNYSSIIVPEDSYVEIQGTISLTSEYSGLNNNRITINGGTISGNGSAVLSTGKYLVFNRVSFNTVGIDCHWATFINCTFSGNCPQLGSESKFYNCQFSSVTTGSTYTLGSIMNSEVSSSTLPRCYEFNNSSITNSTIGNESITNIMGCKLSGSSIYALVSDFTFANNQCKTSTLFINNSIKGCMKATITGNQFNSGLNSSTGVIMIDPTYDFYKVLIYKTIVSGCNPVMRVRSVLPLRQADLHIQ